MLADRSDETEEYEVSSLMIATGYRAGSAMTQASRSPLRILIAEDSPDIGECLAFLLHSAGHDVELVNDGLAAVHTARSYRPDVVLLDIGMPKLDGFEAAWRIRKERGPAVHLIALTAWGREEDKQRGKHAGFDLHLTKPVDMDALIKTLEDFAAQSLRPEPSQLLLCVETGGQSEQETLRR